MKYLIYIATVLSLFISCHSTKHNLYMMDPRLFSRLSDTTITGYKYIYTAEVNNRCYCDTVPFQIKKTPNSCYEVFYYRGQARFTGRIVRSDTIHITDRTNWEKQNLLGLKESPPSYLNDYPILSKKHEMDESHYTRDDIACVFVGKLEKNERYPENGLDSNYVYFNTTGYARFKTYPNMKRSRSLFLSVLPNLRYSTVPIDFDNIKISPDTIVANKLFCMLPDSLLNSKSCFFEFDSIACRNSGFLINPECDIRNIRIQFKDGNHKTWYYNVCLWPASRKYSGYEHLPWMKKMVEELRTFISRLP